MAAGLFDSPWVIVTLVLVSAIANWLSKRRADQAGENPPGDSDSDSATPAAPPPLVPSWEERLRRMLEDKSEEAPRPSAPPPLIRQAPPVRTPVVRQTTPPRVEISPADEPELGQAVTRRYELSDAAHAAQAQQAAHRRQLTKTRRPVLGSLRHPETARQAFAAALVFGPPKGLEL